MKILGSELTSYKTYVNRRKFIQSAITTSIATSMTIDLYAAHNNSESVYNNQLSKNDVVNTYEEITTYNNFYEFGTGKSDPSSNSGQSCIGAEVSLSGGSKIALKSSIEEQAFIEVSNSLALVLTLAL